jgi:hypothetical protein
VSFYVSTATFFLLHCDEWDRVVALPRHKFVTGATLLQLGTGVLRKKIRTIYNCKHCIAIDLILKQPKGQEVGKSKNLFIYSTNMI